MLIVVLAALSLLSLLAVSFVRIQGIERRITRNYLDEVRARLAAQSGIEMAIDRIWGQIREGWFAPRRWDEAGPPVRVDGEERSKTGSVGGTYEAEGDIYSVQVLDCQGQINVNDGAENGPGHATSQNLRRILNALGGRLGAAKLGDRVLAHRPPGGYSSLFELHRGVSRDPEEFRRIRDYLTVNSWRNDRVHSPVPLSAEAAREYPVAYDRPMVDGRAQYRQGHGRDRTGRAIDRIDRPWPLRWYDPRAPDPPGEFPSYCAVWSLDALDPLWIETVSRSPVNVNTASREVLGALVDGLEGFFLVDRRGPVPSDQFYGFMSHRYGYGPDLDRRTRAWSRKGSELGYLYRTAPIASDLVVDEILARREGRFSPHLAGVDYGPMGPGIRSWAQFNELVDRMVDRGLLKDVRNIFFDYEPAAAGAVRMVPSDVQKAQASRALGDVLKANFNPNLHLNELNPDAAIHACVDKTDLIVQSTEFCFVPMGTFEIRSEGMILKSEGLEYGCVARSKHQAIVRFYEPSWHGLQCEMAGGELGEPRTGQSTANGRSVMTGPQPGREALTCEWDGYIQLAPVSGRKGSPGIYDSLAHEEGSSLEGPARSDGFYAQLGSMRGFVMPEFREQAVVSFWIKPSWDPTQTGRARLFVTMAESEGPTRGNPYGPMPFGLFFLPSWHGPEALTGGYGSPAPRSSLLWAVGVRKGIRRGGGGHGVELRCPFQAHRWTHVAASCHAGVGEIGRRTKLFIDGGEVGSDLMVHIPDLPDDLRGLYGATVRLGGDYSESTRDQRFPRNYYADATLAEFQAWFDDPTGLEGSAAQYRAGRFYRPKVGDDFDGNFTSATEVAGGELVGIAWTEYRSPGGRCRVKVLAGSESEEAGDEGWTPLERAGRPVRVVFQFMMGGSGPIVESPVIDDWTLFLSSGRSKFLSYCAADVP